MSFATPSTHGERLGPSHIRNASVQVVPPPPSQKGPLATRRLGDRWEAPAPRTDFDRTSFPPQLGDRAGRPVVVVPKPPRNCSPPISGPISSAATTSKQTTVPAPTQSQEPARAPTQHRSHAPPPNDEGVTVDLASSVGGTPLASPQPVPSPSSLPSPKNNGFFRRFFRALFCFSTSEQNDA